MVSSVKQVRRSMFVGVASIVIVAACSPPRALLQAYDAAPDASPAGVLLQGILEVRADSPCVQLFVVAREPVGLVWPAGYSSTFDPLRVYDEAGLEVASAGDAVTVSGDIVDQPSAYCGTTSLFHVFQVTKGGIDTAS